MNADPKDDLDRAIDHTLASMVGGEPHRVSAASVRRAMGESRRSSLPVWLAAAAVLIVALGVALKSRAPVAPGPTSAGRSIVPTSPVEARATPSADSISAAAVAIASSPGTAGVSPARKGRSTYTTTEAPYEGLPRLTTASIGLPDPLSTERLEADPIQISRIEIAPLAISSLSPEQEHK